MLSKLRKQFFCYGLFLRICQSISISYITHTFLSLEGTLSRSRGTFYLLCASSVYWVIYNLLGCWAIRSTWDVSPVHWSILDFHFDNCFFVFFCPCSASSKFWSSCCLSISANIHRFFFFSHAHLIWFVLCVLAQGFLPNQSYVVSVRCPLCVCVPSYSPVCVLNLCLFLWRESHPSLLLYTCSSLVIALYLLGGIFGLALGQEWVVPSYRV